MPQEALKPNPAELSETIDWEGQEVCIRPIRPEDSDAHQEFFKALSPADVHNRIFSVIRELSPSQLWQLTHLDYDRNMAFIASTPDAHGKPHTLGVVRVSADEKGDAAEFAICIRSDLKGHGLGYLLMNKLIRYCRQRGFKKIVGETLSGNSAMLELAGSFGFSFAAAPESHLTQLELQLNPA